jgi:hypothetical protein
MSRRLKQAFVVVVVLFAAAQLVRPNRTNPATTFSHTIDAHAGAVIGLAPVLNRSCGDCHSNATVWPWYTQVAPVSWLMAYGVAEGRKAANFSEWSAYSSSQRQTILAVSCDDVKSGKMPGIYTWVRPETKLSSGDIDTICTASRQIDAPAAGATP